MIIKFRGKRVDNGEWVYGYVMQHKRYMDLNTYIKSSRVGVLEWLEVIPESVGQYTNICDKHKKDIFTGMNVKYFNRSGVVKFSSEKAAFCIYSADDGAYVPLEEFVAKDTVIIDE